MATIFISYRRADSADITGRIYDRLVERYGRVQVFKDVDSIPAGVDFSAYIAASIQASDVALVVIGPRWLSASSGFGQRRLDDPADFVRVEIETALGLGVPVIPVLVGGASLPPARRLPERLRPLLRQNGLDLRHDPDFSRDAERIFAAIDYWQAQPRRPIVSTVSTASAASSPTPASTVPPAPEPPEATLAAPTRIAVASEQRARHATVRRLPKPRLAPLLIGLSALVVLAVSTTLLLNGTAQSLLSQRRQQPTQTTDLVASTRTTAAITATARTMIDTLPYSPQGGPGPCAPPDEQYENNDGGYYWSTINIGCDSGTKARINAGQPMIFYGRPYSSGPFPYAFEMDATMSFASSGAGDCALLTVQYQANSNEPMSFCRDGTWSDFSRTHPLAVSPPYVITMKVTRTTISLSVNSKMLLSNALHLGQVYLITFDARGANCVVEVSKFTLKPQT